MNLTLFSKRHQDRLKSGKLQINMSPQIKQRILYAVNQFDQTYYESNDGFNYATSFTEDLESDLLHEHGWEHLKAYQKDAKDMQEVNIQGFIKNGAPYHIFDSIELFYRIAEDKYGFQEKINKIFRDSSLPWLLSDGMIFQVDSEHMAEVLECASKLLKKSGFGGANQEFQEARSHFDSGDSKGAIHHANLSLESTMKAVLGAEKETGAKLIRKLIGSGIIPTYYEGFLENFRQLLMTVSIARNEEAAHGQGPNIKEIPHHLAELVLNFCGSLLVFLVNHHVDKQPEEQPLPEILEDLEIFEDDIPF